MSAFQLINERFDAIAGPRRRPDFSFSSPSPAIISHLMSEYKFTGKQAHTVCAWLAVIDRDPERGLSFVHSEITGEPMV